jgi:hypothetical protein
MKTKSLCVIVICFALAICACRSKVSNVEPEPRRVPVGTCDFLGLDTYFVDTLTRKQAKEFITSLGLTIIDFSRYDSSSPHVGSAGVPIGEEQKWADSLRTYEFIVSVVPIYVCTQEIPAGR